MKNFLLGCDWGTSAFRLGLYNLGEQRLMGEIETDDGISGIHRHWKNDLHNPGGPSLRQVFRDSLHQQIQKLSRQLSIPLDNIPVLISGMASSSIGLEDLPYANLPFPLDGSGAVTRVFRSDKEFPHEIMLISGVKGTNDVMRGEETQLVGIAEMMQAHKSAAFEGVIICPGTHSKHLYVKAGKIIHFKTFMTGELFDILGHHSILREAISWPSGDDLQPSAMMAFRTGVHAAGKNNLLQTLFSVRTNRLFDLMNHEENGYYLSGLLIGTEMADLSATPEEHCFLCSGKKLHDLYRIALEEMGLGDRSHFIPTAWVETAALNGQRIIYDHFLKQEPANG